MNPKVINSIIIALALLTATLIYFYGMRSHTPQIKVIDSFVNKFPSVRDLLWEETEDQWVARFRLQDRAYSAYFLKEDQWQKTEYEINNQALPKAVLQGVKARFSDCPVQQARIAHNQEGRVFVVRLKAAEGPIEVTLDNMGKVVLIQKEIENK